MTNDLAFIALLAILGLAFGSFANVVIWRLPRGESLSTPASHCPSCETPIAWHDNVPIVSWLVLRGRCRHCSASIAVRYPLVEAGTAALWVAAGVAFGPTAQCITAAVFFYVLLLLAAIDLDTMRLPNRLVAVLAGIGLAGAVISEFSQVKLAPLAPATLFGGSPLASAVLGAVLAVVLTGGMAGAYHAIRGIQGFGMGDIKLLGAMGLFLGPYVLLALFFGSILGAVAGIAATRSSGSVLTKFPFGPYLAAGGVVTALVGAPLWGWYLGVLAG